MKFISFIIIVLIFQTTLTLSQCNHLTRGLTEIWGDFPIEKGKLLNDYDSTSGLLMDLREKNAVSIFVDFGFKPSDTLTFNFIFKAYMHLVGGGATTNYRIINVSIFTSSDNVIYDSLYTGRLNPYDKFLLNVNRFIKFTFFSKIESSQGRYEYDTLFLKELQIINPKMNNTITQTGVYKEFGDKVTLIANIPPEYINDCIITWHSTTLPKEGVIGDSIIVNSPGVYYFEYFNPKWWCRESSEKIEVKKDINGVVEFYKDIPASRKYFNYLGQEIDEINEYNGQYLEILYFKNKVVTNKLIK